MKMTSEHTCGDKCSFATARSIGRALVEFTELDLTCVTKRS
jgi:hypothetical protein